MGRAAMMDDSPNDVSAGKLPPDHAGALLMGVLMMGGGWWGLYLLVTNTLPRIGGPLWAFFALLFVAVTGTALPLVRYLNVRFTPLDGDVAPGGVIVRQSVWIALFVVLCAWLQLLKTPAGSRVLSLPIAFFIALILGVLEVVLRTRERAAEQG